MHWLVEFVGIILIIMVAIMIMHSQTAINIM